MKTKLFSLLRRVEKIDNTPATGHGDFATVSYKTVMTIAANSERQAKNRFNKIFGKLHFGDKFPSYACAIVK